MSQHATLSNEKKSGARKGAGGEHERNSRAVTGSFPDHVAVVQQTLGNQAALRLVRSGAVQAKLTVSRPDDIYEQEADRVADQVMRMQEPVVQTKPGCPFANGPSCGEEEGVQTKPLPISPLLQKQPIEEEEELKRKAVEEEEEVVHAKNETAEPPEVSNDVEHAIHTLSGGSRLPETVRSFMEPRFGTDFSRVRMHNDAGAAELARSVNAQAFTVGRDIVFGAGRYSPETESGKRLLAHELTHVVQQGGDMKRQKEALHPALQKKLGGKDVTHLHQLTHAVTPNKSQMISREECKDIGLYENGPNPPKKKEVDTDFKIPGILESGSGSGYMAISTSTFLDSARIDMRGYLYGHYGNRFSRDEFEDKDSGVLKYECSEKGDIEKVRDFSGSHSSPSQVEVIVDHETPAYKRTADAVGKGHNAVEGRVKATTEVKISKTRSVGWSAGVNYKGAGVGGSGDYGVSYGTKKVIMAYPYAFKCACRGKK